MQYGEFDSVLLYVIEEHNHGMHGYYIYNYYKMEGNWEIGISLNEICTKIVKIAILAPLQQCTQL